MKLSLPTRLVLAAMAACVAGLVLVPAPAQAASYVPITGAGSTWSQVAVDAWRADVRASGVVVNYTGSGSTDGRSQYIQGTVDFANTEIPFQNPPEPGQQAEVPSRPYAYLPIVAGGTSFMYNLTVGGQRVTDLRLSGPTLAKIFTGQITRWSDPAIKNDYGKTLPDIPIIPVVRSDGAGASAQFTLYMQSQTPSVYCPFIRGKLHLGGSSCPSVSFYPAFGSSKAQNGSNGVANYVSASYGAGAIGYVEYAYAKRINFPVVSLLNKAGYFSQPTAGNVAVALTRARINKDLTQNLQSVYTNPDPRAYPMSSYSYMVVPTHDGGAVQLRQGQDALDVRQLLLVHRPAEGRHPRLLAPAEEPRARRLQAGLADPRPRGVAGDQPVPQPRPEHPPVGPATRQVHEARLRLHRLVHDGSDHEHQWRNAHGRQHDVGWEHAVRLHRPERRRCERRTRWLLGRGRSAHRRAGRRRLRDDRRW